MVRRSNLSSLSLCEEDLSLITDLYELTMAAVYATLPDSPRATFELFVRSLPANRNFLVFAGLEQALASLEAYRFSASQIDYLRGLGPFQDVGEEFFAALENFRFQGEIWAMPEGTVFFPQEPVMRVSGSLFEAQIIETLLLSIVNFQTAIASKAARIRLVAEPQVQLAEFGGRRAHGPQAAAWVARAAYLAGFDATSNLLAGAKLGVPVVGTMAHSFIMAFATEQEAFERYLEVFPRHSILLVDTYDTLEGVRRACRTGRAIAGVRLDSGNLAVLAREARKILDQEGLSGARIFASGDLNEYKIARLLARGVPIDAFGVGTQLSACADAPYVGGIYKLVEVERGGRAVGKFKESTGKATYPGKKQVVRRFEDGTMAGDRIVPLAESLKFPEESRLLIPVMDRGRVLEAEPLERARDRCRRQLEALPARLQELDTDVTPYQVVIDPLLEAHLEEERKRREQGGG